MAKKFGFDVTQQSTAKYGGKDGISGGGTQFNQIKLNDQFNVVRKPERNIDTDKPYDHHIDK